MKLKLLCRSAGGLRHALVLGLLLLVAGCSSVKVIRLGPGDCVVVDGRDQIITAGKGCDIQRVYK